MTLASLKIILISSRDDVLSFCSDILEPRASLKIEMRRGRLIFDQTGFFIIDAGELISAPSDFIDGIKSNISRILMLIPADAPKSLADFTESICENIVTFPLNEDYFLFCLQNLIATMPDKSRLGDFCADDEPDCQNLLGFFGGKSGAMCDLRRKIARAGQMEASVLLLGETGTGKSTAANIIHKISARGRMPFMSMNVSTISDSLACSTLFGTENGAFTDAVKSEGLFKAADGGSLFLDEVGMASLSLQAMLLTALETGMIQKVGKSEAEKVDVRVIFATNAPIKNMLQQGLFRPDLYFRISDMVIQIPPLRERKEDLEDLAQDYARKHNKTLSADAIRVIEDYDWPGNIRELQQCLNRAFHNCAKNEISGNHIDFGLFN